MRWLFLCAFFLLAQLPAYAALTHIGTGKGGAGSGSSFSVTANQTPTSGDVLVIAVFALGNSAITPPANWVSDEQPSAGASMYLGHCVVTASNCSSASLGTFAFAGSQGYCFAVEEFGGVSASPVEVAEPIQSYGGSVTSPSYTVTPPSDPAGIFAVYGSEDNRSPFTAGSGYVAGIVGTDGSHGWCYDEWTSPDIASGSSNVAGTLTTGTHNLFMGAIVLKTSAGGNPAPASNRWMMGCCK